MVAAIGEPFGSYPISPRATTLNPGLHLVRSCEHTVHLPPRTPGPESPPGDSRIEAIRLLTEPLDGRRTRYLSREDLFRRPEATMVTLTASYSGSAEDPALTTTRSASAPRTPPSPSAQAPPTSPAAEQQPVPTVLSSAMTARCPSGPRGWLLGQHRLQQADHLTASGHRRRHRPTNAPHTGVVILKV